MSEKGTSPLGHTEWARAVEKAVAPERAKLYGEQLSAAGAGDYFERITREQAGVLAALFSGSRAMSEQLIAHPEWLEVVEEERLRSPRRLEGLRREVAGWLPGLLQAKDYAGLLRRVREFKQREMLRIAARDLAGLGQVEEITEEISNVADISLHVVYRVCLDQMIQRHGVPYTMETTGEWQPASFSNSAASVE